ncbi:hypothetical protein ACE01C_10005 [Moraxella sp. ZJ171]
MKYSNLSQYRQLMRIRLKIFFYLPLVLLIFTLFLIKMGVHIAIITTLVAGCIYFSIFYFLSKNICPWCKGSFLVLVSWAIKTLGMYFLQKKCQHCGRPHLNDF